MPALFDARVLNVICKVTGDCPDDCGAADRQIGHLRSAENVMVVKYIKSQAALR